MLCTWDDTAGEARNALHFCDVIFTEILVAGGIEIRGVTEQRPQLCGHGDVVDDLSF